MAITPGPYINWTQIMHGLLKVGTTDCFTLQVKQSLGGTRWDDDTPRGNEEDETEAGRKKTKKSPGHPDNAARRERQGGAHHQPAEGEY